MQVNKEAGSVAMTVVMVVVALVVGFGAGRITMNKDDNKTTTNSSEKMTANSQVDGVTVGGAVMVRDKDIVDNAVNAKNVTTVVAAVKAA